MKKTKLEKGITLVALIITIVVLLILAVVSIGAVRNSGIIGHATNTSAAWEKSKENETLLLTGYELELRKQTLGIWGKRGLATVILDKPYCGFTNGADKNYIEVTFTSDGSVIIQPDTSDSSANNPMKFESNEIDQMISSEDANVESENVFWLDAGDEFRFKFSVNGRELEIVGFSEVLTVDYEREDYSVPKTRIYISKNDSNSGIVLNEDGYWYTISEGKISSKPFSEYQFKENVEIHVSSDSNNSTGLWRCLIWSRTEPGGSRYAYVFGIILGGTELYYIDSQDGEVVDGIQTYRKFEKNTKIGEYVLAKDKTLADFQ